MKNYFLIISIFLLGAITQESRCMEDGNPKKRYAKGEIGRDQSKRNRLMADAYRLRAERRNEQQRREIENALTEAPQANQQQNGSLAPQANQQQNGSLKQLIASIKIGWSSDTIGIIAEYAENADFKGIVS